MPTVKTSKPRYKSKTAAWRSGARALGIDVGDALQIVGQVQTGFTYRCFATFERISGLSREKIARFAGIPLRTLTRRRSTGKLRPEESDRVLRASRIFGMAVELFEGDVGAARQWLLSPQRGLGGAVPLEFAATEIGAREVEQMIDRLEYGVFS